MCKIFVTESSEFYSQYEKQLIMDQYKDAEVEEVDPKDVIDRVCKETPDAIVLDNRLPGVNGAEFINAISKCSPNTKIIIVSSDRRGLKGIKDAALAVFDKPLLVPQFMSVIGQVYYGG